MSSAVIFFLLLVVLFSPEEVSSFSSSSSSSFLRSTAVSRSPPLPRQHGSDLSLRRWRRRHLLFATTRFEPTATPSSSSSSSEQDDDASTSFDTKYFSIPDPQTVPRLPTTTLQQRMTLTRYLNNVVKEHPELRDLESLLLSVQMACKTISNLVNRAGLVYGTDRTSAAASSASSSASLEGRNHDNVTTTTANTNTDTATKQQQQQQQSETDGRYYSMKRLDQLSTEVLKNALEFTGKCQMVGTPALVAELEEETPAEHQPGVLIATALDSNYVACLDPLDGSGNADASICTGTVFGVFENSAGKSFDGKAILQPAENMRAAGYCLYSSATVLVLALGNTMGVQGFTLDPSLKEFVLTHPNLTIPSRGSVYSCNEANSEGWSDEFKQYLSSLKTGTNEMQRPYALRYVGSMVGDIHRTLLYGGIFAYPSDTVQHPHGNLQLLYKSAPMAYVVSQAGGMCIDETCGNLLAVQPERIHQKSPCFIGSPDDVQELKTYLQKNINDDDK